MTSLLLASAKVLPSVLLRAYDFAITFRDRSSPVIGGFHTSLEKECLEILLRGQVPITICPARTFDPDTVRLYHQHPKMRSAVKQGVADGRVTILQPPGMIGARVTKVNAVKRNDFVLDQSQQVVLLYASPEGETDRVVRRALNRGLPVLVLDHPANAPWLEMGATVWK